jgi:aspartate aminotransferase-like enzyme
VLALVNGAFSERFARIAQQCDRRARVLAVPWGQAHDEAVVARALADERFAAMLVVHCETSTGAVNDVRMLARLAHAAGAACLVDSVSGVGGIPLEADAWDLDFVFTGSQKALGMPPGLAFGVASESFILAASSTPMRGRYLDLVQYEEFAAKSQVPHTPALPLFYAAEAQLERIGAEGMEARWARHATMLRLVEAWVDDCRRDGIDVAFLAPAGARAATVSVLTLPEGLTGPSLCARVQAGGFTIAPGSGAMRDTTIRIGHMGEHAVATLEPCLAAVRSAMRD